jgi:hypothetical protein
MAKPARTVRELLWRLGACKKAREWAAQYGSDFKRAWDECPSSYALLWAMGKLRIPRARYGCALTAHGIGVSDGDYLGVYWDMWLYSGAADRVRAAVPWRSVRAAAKRKGLL